MSEDAEDVVEERDDTYYWWSHPKDHHGMCLPVEVDAEQAEWNRKAELRNRRHLALWHVASRLRESQDRGPSLWDEGDATDPRAELRQAWADWCGLTGAEPEFQLAWAIGALRLLGVVVENAEGKPRILPNGRKAEDIAPLLDLLRTHRDAVVKQLAVGPFDSLAWQLDLIRKAAGDWPVWGARIAGPADACRSSVLPVLVDDVPPFYDTLQVYRPDCFRAIPAAAMNAMAIDRTLGGRLAAGMVYVGPAVADYPDGKGKVLYEELKIRKAHGHTACVVRP